MRSLRKFTLGSLMLVSVAALAVSCGKKSSDDDDDTAATTATGVSSTPTTTTTASADSMLSVYPSQLALALFTESSGTSLNLADEVATTADEEAAEKAAAKPMKERGEEQEKRLKGLVDDCVADALKRPPINGMTETCYEFDQDMIYGTKLAGSSAMGTFDGLNSEGVPCMVAFAKSRVAVVNDLLERAQGMVSTMLCQAKKADANAEPPKAVGDTQDLKAILAGAMGKKAEKIVTAKVERLADVDSQSVYKSTVEMQQGEWTRTVVLVHSPASDGTYHGTLYTIMHREMAALNGPGAGNFDHVLSVNYAKVKTATGFELQGDLIRANLATDLVPTALGETGFLDLSAYRDFSVAENDQHYGAAKKADGTYYNHNEDASGQTRITFAVDPDTDAGVVSYAENPGSNYNEAARGMIAKVEIVGGVKKGCATSGAALGKTNLMQAYSIAKSQKEGVTLDFVGFYHPFYNADVQGGGPSCSMTSNPGAGADGTFYEKSCTEGGQTAVSKWYQPDVSDAVLAQQFVTEQVGGVVTRQCYVYEDGAYKIDTAEITDAAGFQLVKNDVAGKLVAPPTMDAKVKPFDGGIAKKDD